MSITTGDRDVLGVNIEYQLGVARTAQQKSVQFG